MITNTLIEAFIGLYKGMTYYYPKENLTMDYNDYYSSFIISKGLEQTYSANGYKAVLAPNDAKIKKEFIIYAIRCSLYVKDWNLLPTLLYKLTKRSLKDFQIALTFVENPSINVWRCVAVSIVTDSDKPRKNRVQFYVTPKYRRRGIASSMLALFKKNGINPNQGQKGIKGSEAFLKKHNLKI